MHGRYTTATQYESSGKYETRKLLVYLTRNFPRVFLPIRMEAIWSNYHFETRKKSLAPMPRILQTSQSPLTFSKIVREGTLRTVMHTTLAVVSPTTK